MTAFALRVRVTFQPKVSYRIGFHSKQLFIKLLFKLFCHVGTKQQAKTGFLRPVYFVRTHFTFKRNIFISDSYRFFTHGKWLHFQLSYHQREWIITIFDGHNHDGDKKRANFMQTMLMLQPKNFVRAKLNQIPFKWNRNINWKWPRQIVFIAMNSQRRLITNSMLAHKFA